MSLREREPSNAQRTAVLWLLALTVAFMVYASLYPFELDADRLRSLGQEDWLRSLAWRRPARTDLIANLLFYLPFGALLTILTPRHWRAPVRVLFVAACGVLLSVLIECAQFATRTRDPSITDVAINASSAGLASLLALGARRLGLRPGLPQLRTSRPDPMALLLIVLWLAFHAAPFMPTPRFVWYWNNPLRMIDVYWSLADAAGFFAGYVIVCAALAGLLRRTSFWPAFLACATLSLLARVVFRGHRLGLDECLGFLLAVPVAWHVLRGTERSIPRRAAFWSIPAFLFFALAPFAFSAAAPDFQWLSIPAATGRTLAGEPGIIETAFFCIGIVWLLTEGGLPLRRVVAGVLAAALCIEVGQAWQVGKAAHLAAPVLVLCAGFLVWARERLRPEVDEAGRAPA